MALVHDIPLEIPSRAVSSVIYQVSWHTSISIINMCAELSQSNLKGQLQLCAYLSLTCMDSLCMTI